ncbi:hypothetical protein GQ53DRAFT_743491 [Thozetella sp. PMI_491]|nr:hypothetical protein GQ53DRAFT_743491 [Thozetella sp. PMI_491]
MEYHISSMKYNQRPTISRTVSGGGGWLQAAEIEDCCFHCEHTVEATYKCLSEEENEFVQYDQQDSPEMQNEGPYGEDVPVHAVALTGEVFAVAARTAPGALKRHAKG